MSALSTSFQQILAALDQMEIQFLIGGSVASGSLGFPRQTNGIDLLADLRNVNLPDFQQLLGDSFYMDTQGAEMAVAHGRPFNIIDLRSGFKFDFFPAEPAGFHQSELNRRRYIISAMPGLESIEFPISSAEDTILAKLEWFRKGNETSDRQWHDILAIAQVQALHLDRDYLRRWSIELGVGDLLDRIPTLSK